MKNLIIISSFVLSFGAMAATVEEKIAQIEAELGVKCEQIGESEIAMCVGDTSPALHTCFYKVRFACDGAEMLRFDLKVKEYFDSERAGRTTKVRKIIWY